MTINLVHNLGFSWYKNKTVFVKGYFYDEKNIFYQKEDALLFLSSIKNKQDFKNFIHKINGVYSIVIIIKNDVFITLDVTRAFPIFYTYQKNELFISDDIVYLKNKFKLNAFNKLSEIELKASNHTYGRKTLLKDIFQFLPSEYVIIQKNKIIESNFSFSYAIEKESSSSYNTLKKEMIIAFENTFKRCIDSLQNKTVVLPLSGGFDSRIIAVMLKKYNYTNVICYTYGRKDSFEIENSKKTAKALNFKWLFIDYNKNLTSNILEFDEFKNFTHYAGKYSSMPNLQEYFAVKYLKDNKLIPLNAVFIPGYAGDLLGGSQFLKVIPEALKTKDIIPLIFKEKLSNYPISNSEEKKLKIEIQKNLEIIDKNYPNKIPYSVFENYDILEKIAKYIFNSASFYSFFGYEHRFPFWDKELLYFFKSVPVKYKKMKLLFDDVLIHEYFKKYAVYFKNELQPTKKQLGIQKIKQGIKPFFPTFIKQKKLKSNDWVNYQPITKQMLDLLKNNKIKIRRQSNNYNEIITQWYVALCKNKID